MSEAVLTQADIVALNAAYVSYIGGLRADWLTSNQVQSKDVLEVMGPADKAQVHSAIRAWQSYVTPLAEAWWRERGFGVKWPDDDSRPVQIFRLP